MYQRLPMRRVSAVLLTLPSVFKKDLNSLPPIGWPLSPPSNKPWLPGKDELKLQAFESNVTAFPLISG